LRRITLETKNFDTGRELLLVSCPVKDDSDYEHIYLDACEIATQDLKNWLEENNIPVEYFVSWGKPYESEFEDSIDFYLNYFARIYASDVSDEAEMIYKMRFTDKFPIRNLKPYVEKVFK